MQRKRDVLLTVLVAGILLAGGSVLAGCSTLTKAEREAKRAERAAQVAKGLDSKHYQIDVSTMNTRRMGSKMLTSDWSLEVRGDTLISYLPYVGVTYEAPYGEVKGLNFTAPFKAYEDGGFFAKGVRTIRFRVDSGEDVIDYTLSVTEAGYADIDIVSRAREGISFSGQMKEFNFLK